MGRKKVSVIHENETGRNKEFRDNYRKTNMSKNEFVSEIRSGKYDNYHIRNINGVDTPVSNPDKSKNNNLG
ncbi:hypothetical protein SAMN05421734_10617 [Pelagirhabdus alkalitolerans]|uniref:DUF3892 domain-containing protein n=1 Tax=Pelagirhabdus alkalitolerans TaxID=1612202 RepID=A0A1G6KBN2_9BACI|nr:hypothetical protein [Pelagirhabdus alkalitolerans]SDC27975.1 hypothetical protein SAMN05421734_10617 [Pelagirhabdus alkalitolerans]